MFQTLNGEQTDIPLEVHLMQSVGGCEGPGAPVLLLDWFHLGQELVLVQERPVPFVDLLTYMQSKEDPLQEQEAKVCGGQLGWVCSSAFMVHPNSCVFRCSLYYSLFIR